MSRSVDPQCSSFQAAIDILARPWNGLLLGALQNGPLRFSQLAKRTPGVGPKILSARLKDLEARGVVRRKVQPGPPVRVLYALTPNGRGFLSVARAIERWGRALSTAPTRQRKLRGPVRTPLVTQGGSSRKIWI
jgi:DNA-binding HxlR family transcriptional regulator